MENHQPNCPGEGPKSNQCISKEDHAPRPKYLSRLDSSRDRFDRLFDQIEKKTASKHPGCFSNSAEGQKKFASKRRHQMECVRHKERDREGD
jgi:hypothetical protein